MKTKISIREGVQYLEVADKEINDKSQYGSPIVLAVITHFFNSGCWSFEDYRLKSHLIPSKYLNDSNEQIYNFNEYSEEDKKVVLSKLHDYSLSEKEGLFYWRYETVDLNGDIPPDDKRKIDSIGNKYPHVACFTFKAAQKKLREAKEFWDNYEGSLTNEEIKISNPHRQPHQAEYYNELSFNKERLEKLIKMKV